MTRAGVAMLIAAGVLACAGPETYEARVREARGIAQAYLQAVSTDTEDRGWSLLHPMAQEVYGPYERYVETAEAIEWSGFRWRQQPGEASASCDDLVICEIRLEIDGGVGNIPPFLIEPPRDVEEGRAGIIQVQEVDDIGTLIEIVVLFDRLPFGPSGVAAQRGG
jgi:hypothetical protein